MDINSYPIHVYSAKNNAALKLFIRSIDKDIEYICRVAMTKGFKIFFHTPGNALISTDAFIRVGFSEAVEISSKPKMITTSDALRQYRPEQRQCFFNSERQLHFFDFYSQENCKAECIANFTLGQCGCVPFFFPSKFHQFACWHSF